MSLCWDQSFFHLRRTHFLTLYWSHPFLYSSVFLLVSTGSPIHHFLWVLIDNWSENCSPSFYSPISYDVLIFFLSLFFGYRRFLQVSSAKLYDDSKNKSASRYLSILSRIRHIIVIQYRFPWSNNFLFIWLEQWLFIKHKDLTVNEAVISTIDLFRSSIDYAALSRMRRIEGIFLMDFYFCVLKKWVHSRIG